MTLSRQLKVGLIAPKTFDYAEALKLELESLFTEVRCHEEWTEGIWVGLAKRLGYYRWLCTLRNNRFLQTADELDVLLVIRGSTLGDECREQLAHLTATCKILYEWDSVRNLDYRSLLPSFDYVATFDPEDAEALAVTYQPLFFVPTRSLEDGAALATKDISYICSYSSERYGFLSRLLAGSSLTAVTHIYEPLVSKLKAIFAGQKRATSSKRMPRSEVYRHLEASRCVVDYQHRTQSGMTMRTIEALSLGKKLATTNSRIIEEPFYTENMICVLDSEAPTIDQDWLNAPAEPVDMSAYRVDRWLVTLIERGIEEKERTTQL